MSSLQVFACFVACLAVTGGYGTFKQDLTDFQTLSSILDKPRVPDRFKPKNAVVVYPRVDKFSWAQCDKSAIYPVNLTSLALGPDPLKLPGNVTVAASGSVSQDLTSPIKLKLEIKKKVLIWVPIPCVDNIGSCSYDDACVLLQNITCPPFFKKYGIPCQCPISKGSYSLPSTNVTVDPPSSVPTWLTDGDYKVQASITKNGTVLFCFNIDVSIAKA